jgi:hypothetical protein
MKRARYQASLFLTFMTLGTASAWADPDGPPAYQYRTCSRIVELLHDLSGNREKDRRELTANLPGDPVFQNYLFDHQFNSAAKAAIPAGTIDNVLEVYLATDRSRKECEATGCAARLRYDNGTEYVRPEEIAIDKDSVIVASIDDHDIAQVTPLHLRLGGRARSVTVHGKTDVLQIFQTGVFFPCPAPQDDMPKCEDFLGSLPQEDALRHDTFQTVMIERTRKRNPGKAITCAELEKKLPLSSTQYGDPGNNTYRFARGDGRVTIWDSKVNELVFAPDIKAEDLWFTQDSRHVYISVLGTDDFVTIRDAAFRLSDFDQVSIEKIRSGDGKVIDQRKLRLLVDAMKPYKASSATDPSGIKPGARLPAKVKKALAAAWRPEQ